MDFIDVILAKSLTPQGQIDTFAAKAQKAVSDANKVLNTTEQAMENINSITAQTNGNNRTALDTLDRANEALTKAEQASQIIDESVAQSIDTEIDKVDISAPETTATDYKQTDIEMSYPSGKKARLRNINKIYNKMGQNTDGSMTQKAITDAINNIPSSGGGGTISFNEEDAGKVVIVGEDGNATTSDITESDLIDLQIAAGTRINDEVIGLELDYANRTFSRLQGAKGLSAGNDFNKFKMYGGRKRCIVNQSGEIVRFINGLDTVSNVEGQRVMVYQPAFYYARVPVDTRVVNGATVVDKERILLTDKETSGFKLHPAFIDNNSNQLKFILLPAFESGVLKVTTNELVKNNSQDVDLNNDILISTTNIKPITGVSQAFNYAIAKRMCENNGTGWSMSDLSIESLNQMLMIVEYGNANVTSSLGLGIINITYSSGNNGAITGSTFDLANTSGRATSTVFDLNGSRITYQDDGRCAISYRGMENPYGSIRRYVNNFEISNGVLGVNGHDYTNVINTTEGGWINSFSYNSEIDWAFLPIEVNGGANSTLPVGDYDYVSTNSYLLAGGSYSSGNNAGPFYSYYRNIQSNFYDNITSARVVFRPIANSTIETNNYNLWLQSN